MENIFVRNSGMIYLPVIDDGKDGCITVAEYENHIPFQIKRIYFIQNMSDSEAIRGKHAHKELEQYIFSIKGRFLLHLDDGFVKQDILLDKPNKGVFLGTGLWHTMQKFSDDCVILVLASDVYRETDYIRDYDEFLNYIGVK